MRTRSRSRWSVRAGLILSFNDSLLRFYGCTQLSFIPRGFILVSGQIERVLTFDVYYDVRGNVHMWTARRRGSRAGVSGLRPGYRGRSSEEPKGKRKTSKVERARAGRGRGPCAACDDTLYDTLPALVCGCACGRHPTVRVPLALYMACSIKPTYTQQASGADGTLQLHTSHHDRLALGCF